MQHKKQLVMNIPLPAWAIINNDVVVPFKYRLLFLWTGNMNEVSDQITELN